MKIRTLIAGQVALLFLLNTGVRAQTLTRFDAKPGAGMKVRIEGTSTVHDWQVEGHLIAGSVEAGSNFPTDPGQDVKPGKIEARAIARIPVTSLKSIEKDGSPYSDKMDEVMYGKLKADAHRWIVFRVTELTLKEPAKSKDAPYVFDARGELEVAGVTNQVALPVNVLPLGDKKLKISGSTTVKMTDFGVQPPVLIGLLSTGDPVKLSFEWPVQQRKTAEAAK